MGPMPGLSATKNAGGRSSLGRAVFAGLGTLARSVGRTLYVLWLEISGLLFGVFTVMFGAGLVRLYRANAFEDDRLRWWLAVGFTAVCAWFTLVSFWKARRTRRRI